MASDTLQYQPNPDYGSGVFRRRIRLQGEDSRVLAALEDCCHGFELTLLHDGQYIVDIQSTPRRIPLNTCAGATGLLACFAGLPLDSDEASLRAHSSPKQHCTHLYDLALLAIRHARRGVQTRVIDITVGDELDGSQELTASIDGAILHRWTTRGNRIETPAKLGGAPMMRGFHEWASKTFDADHLEAATALQRGYFVAQARRFDMRHSAGRRAVDDGMPLGSCHTYSPGVVEQAVRLSDTTRDFTDSPEQLLRFL